MADLYHPIPEGLAPSSCITMHSPAPETAAGPKQFLGLGIISFVDRVPGFNLTSQEIRELIVEETNTLASLGVDLTMFEVNPDDPNVIPLMREKLQSLHWDGVIIGWGIRGTMNLTGIFEVAVNLTVREVQGVKLMFPTSPASVVDSARRVFPDLRVMAPTTTTA